MRKTPTPTKSRARALKNFGESSPYDIPRDEETDREGERDVGDEPEIKRRRLSPDKPVSLRGSIERADKTDETSPPPVQTNERDGTHTSQAAGSSTLSPMLNVTIVSPPNQSALRRDADNIPQQKTSEPVLETRRHTEPQALPEESTKQDSGVSNEPNGSARDRIEEEVVDPPEKGPQKMNQVAMEIDHETTNDTQIAETNGDISALPVSDQGEIAAENAHNAIDAQPDDDGQDQETTINGPHMEITGQTTDHSMSETQSTDTATRSTRPGLRERVKNTVQSSVSRVVDRFRKRKRGAESSKTKEPPPQERNQEQQKRKGKTRHAEADQEPRTGRDTNHEVRIVEEGEGGQPSIEASNNSTVTEAIGKSQVHRSDPKKRTKKPADTNQDAVRPKRLPAVPVTVHRFSNFLALDPQGAEDTPREAGTGTVEQRRRVAQQQTRRSGVNPVDVLSQICREAFDDALSSLQEEFASQPDKKVRADIVRKIKALQAFSAELEHRLFDIREVLDANHTLAAQVRREKREVAMLRAELMEVRRQRNEIELEMDDVRQSFMAEQERNNVSGTCTILCPFPSSRHIQVILTIQKNKQRQVALTTAMHELELALERSKPPDPDDNDEPQNPAAGLEFLLRSVADNVSSAAPDSQGGLLQQIKDLNHQLEYMSAMLE